MNDSFFSMFKDLLEEKKIATFWYRRYQGNSKNLKNQIRAGVLYPSSDPLFVPAESIYFFHGGDSDDQLFLHFIDLLSEENKRKLVERKTQIVLPFIGLSYLKPPHDQFFFEELIPWAEHKMNATTAAKNRMLHGVSMGGTGALNLMLKSPSRFKSLAMHFAGLIRFNPFSDDESNQYQLDTKISDEKLSVLRYCYQSPFRDHEDFLENDPFELLQKSDLSELKRKELYFDVGKVDDFGLWAGAQAFDHWLSKLGVPHVMQVLEGAHDLGFIQNHLNRSFDFLLK